MQNPLEHEEAAFRIVLYALAYFAPIVVASYVASWLGFVVFLLATAVVVVLVRRSRRAGRGPAADVPVPSTSAVADTRRIVVLANETLARASLQDAVAELAGGVADEVVLVCPVGAEPGDAAEAAASARLEAAVDALRRRGVRAHGSVAHADALTALERALAGYGADEVVLSTLPAGRSAWLDDGLVEAVRERYDGPLTHVVEPREETA